MDDTSVPESRSEGLSLTITEVPVRDAFIQAMQHGRSSDVRRWWEVYCGGGAVRRLGVVVFSLGLGGRHADVSITIGYVRMDVVRWPGEVEISQRWDLIKEFLTGSTAGSWGLSVGINCFRRFRRKTGIDPVESHVPQ